MARDIRNFTVSVPPGTTVANPQLTTLSMPARIVRKLRVRIPPGPAGLVGWALASGGQPFLPSGAGEWIVGDNEVIEWELEDQISSGAWQLRAYNLGTYAHSLYLTFALDALGSPTSPILSGPVPL